MHSASPFRRGLSRRRHTPAHQRTVSHHRDRWPVLSPLSVASAERVLAQNGIVTVASESSTKALAKIHGATYLSFAEAQVRAMALGAANGSGLTGSSLDAAAPVPAGDVPMSYLLASWVSTSNTTSAKTVRQLMGTQDWKNPPSVVFPTVALPLFVASVISASQPSASSTTPTSASASDYEPTNGLPGVEVVGLSDSPCSSVSNFIDSTLTAVANELMLNAPTGTGVGAKVGTFFVGLWNGAIALAQSAISGLITLVSAPIVNAIKSVAAAASVIADVVSYLTPWSVHVIPAPATVNSGDGGLVDATVNAGDSGIDYPSSITDCANSFSPALTLPTLSAANADANWSLVGAISPAGATSVKLDDHGKSTIDYTTTSHSCSTSSSASCANDTTNSSSCTNTSADTGSSNQSPLPADIGTATITVTRPGIDQLKTLVDSMLSSGLGVAGTVAGGMVKAIVDPLLSSALGPIENLLSVTGTGYVTVSDHSSDSSTASKNTSTTNTASCEPCMVGDWTTTNVALAGGFSGGAGGNVNIAATGTLVADMDGSTPEDGNAQTGTATWTIKLPEEPTATSGQWVQTAVSGGFSTDIGGTQHFQAAFNSTGTWTCSKDSLTYVLDYPNGDTVTWSLARVAG